MFDKSNTHTRAGLLLVQQYYTGCPTSKNARNSILFDMFKLISSIITLTIKHCMTIKGDRQVGSKFFPGNLLNDIIQYNYNDNKLHMIQHKKYLCGIFLVGYDIFNEGRY